MLFSHNFNPPGQNENNLYILINPAPSVGHLINHEMKTSKDVIQTMIKFSSVIEIYLYM